MRLENPGQNSKNMKKAICKLLKRKEIKENERSNKKAHSYIGGETVPKIYQTKMYIKRSTMLIKHNQQHTEPKAKATTTALGIEKY